MNQENSVIVEKTTEGIKVEASGWMGIVSIALFCSVAIIFILSKYKIFDKIK